MPAGANINSGHTAAPEVTEQKGDLLIRDLWQQGTDIVHDMRVVNTGKLGLYYPPQTITRVPFIIDYIIHAPYYIYSVFYHIHVSPYSLHMSSKHFGVMLSGTILNTAPWYIT